MQSKYSQLTDLLLKNKQAYQEQWKSQPSFDYVEVLNNTYLGILDLLPFKDNEEKVKLQSMAESFKDYETFEAEVLRIGSRLLDGSPKLKMCVDEHLLDNLNIPDIPNIPVPDEVMKYGLEKSHQDEMNYVADEIEENGFYAWVHDNIYDCDNADVVKAYILSVIKLAPEDLVKKINGQLLDRLRNPDKYEGE